MEENFNQVALTRANYYTPGSPVQFVCVELLRGEISGEHAVCLTFKNISRVVLTALEIHFKCKGADGDVLCEDDFEYNGLQVNPGETFGMDDAVFVTSKAITSVDVSLKNVYNGRRVVHLSEIKRVRLPAAKRLSTDLQAALEERMGRKGMKYMPQILENGGWYCACGAFHPKEEDTVYCSECGSDRILLQNALNTLLQPKSGSSAAQPEPQQAELPHEPTRVVPKTTRQEQGDKAENRSATRVVPGTAGSTPAKQAAPAGERAAEAARAEPGRRQNAAAIAPRKMEVPAKVQAQPRRDDYADEYDAEDSIAEALIRWVPPLTAIICAAIALGGFVYYQFVL